VNVFLAELVPNINEFFEWRGWGGTAHQIYEFNKVSLMALASTAICLAIFLPGSRKRALVPVGIQNVAESGYEIIEQQVAVEVMGPEAGKKWTPYLACLFFWIFFINIWEVIPGIQFPATSRLAIPLFLAIVTWFLFVIMGFVHQGKGFVWKAINPSGVPKALKVLVVPIEFFSIFLMRPFSLAIRLFANMTAGHLLLTIFAIMTNELLIVHNSGLYQIAFSPLPFAALVAMTAFEIFVAILQAYIFTILTAVYINESIHPEH
jgi:F-type H+-transporting ATPase subunit a